MKRIFGLLLATALMSNTFAQKQPSLPLESSFPDNAYQLVNVMGGESTTLKNAATDKGLLVIFTCNTCPYVIKNMERTREVVKYAQSKGIGVLMVNSNEAQRDDADAPDKMAAFAKEQQYPAYYVDQDSKLADAFGASHTPEVFLFSGTTQRLVYKGAMDDSPADPKAAKVMYLKNAMNNMLAGKNIEPAETKSIGCSIKRVKK